MTMLRRYNDKMNCYIKFWISPIFYAWAVIHHIACFCVATFIVMIENMHVYELI